MEMPSSHGGHRRRALTILCSIFTGYALFKLTKVQKIRPKERDTESSPFRVDFGVARILKGRHRRKLFGRRLKLTPVVDRYGRGDLKVKLGKHGTVFFHRLVGLEVCPVTTDREGFEVDFSWATAQNHKQFEIHHGVEGDTHNCRALNLFVLYKEHHRRLKKGRRS
jgi:hypothetical protein